MNTWMALFKREWLEHRGGFGWAPVAMLGVLVIAVFLGFTVGDISAREPVQKMLEDRSWGSDELSRGLATLRHGIAKPFTLVFFGVVFFVLLGALFDDRRDRSVLFWKSVPVTDSQTVLSKLITAIWLAPVVTIAMIVAAQLFVLCVLTVLIAGSEHLSIAALWSHSGLIIGAAELVVGFVVQGFWALPLWGWLLLVSAVVTRVPVLWAVLVPVVPALLEWVLFNTSVIQQGISNHLSVRALPIQAGFGLPETFALWATSDMWLGIGVGVIFLAGAVYFRRRNNEI
jgi:ABC-2 type transport system permease protein